MDGKIELKRRLAENRIRIQREKILGNCLKRYDVTIDNFLDMEISYNLKKRAYQKVFSNTNEHLDTLEQVLIRLKNIEKRNLHLKGVNVVLYYQTLEIEAIEISLKTCFEIIYKFINKNNVEILVTSLDMTYGLCLEMEEYNYLLTIWGFNN